MNAPIITDRSPRAPRRGPLLRLGLLLALIVGLLPGAQAQAHRATRLGDPAHRFAPPLQGAEDLRKLLQDDQLQADIKAILDQAGWPGNPEDLRHAASTGEIARITLPPGTRMPFMSSRDQGKPVALIDVVWAGNAPVEAYTFVFYSRDRGYRLIAPAPCSNFYVEDLESRAAPPPPEALKLALAAPPEAGLCAPFELRLEVQNTSRRPLAGVRLELALPPGAPLTDARTNLVFDVGALGPAEGRLYRVPVKAAAAGPHDFQLRATATGTGPAEATARALVHAPALTLECRAPAEVYINRPTTTTLVLRNAGDAAETNIVLSLAIPAGTDVSGITEEGTKAGEEIRWTIPSLAPQASREVAANFSLAEPGQLAFAANARGACAPPVQSACETRVTGIRGILVEVVDLEDPIEVGNLVTYDIRVLNQGSAALAQVRLVCTLPELQEFASGSGATAAAADGRKVTFEPLATLAPKQDATWRVLTRASKAGDARFKVEVSTEHFAHPIEEYEATQQY